MDSDEENFVFVGTPIEREDELNSRKKKALAEASSQLRTLPSWKQEVRDEEGRRRFHGAFTGGFSAGYYNTVGSKEGWAPQTFSSSRKNRTEFKKQSVLDFLDDDEKAEMEGHLLGTSSQFDTFGFTAAELARKQADKEQNQRPSAIPGPVPDELIVPATESIGVKLLQKMGWRRGRSIKESCINSLNEVRREARKAFLSLSINDKAANLDGSEPMLDHLEEPDSDATPSSQCTPVYVRQPKQDLYGLGYDPYKHAPEFREMKRSRLSNSTQLGIRNPFSSKREPVASNSGRLAPGFGIGALEELDVEDEDVYASGYNYTETYVADDEEVSRLTLEDKQKENLNDLGYVPRFKATSNSEYQFERFDPPTIPKDFVARHKFHAPLDANSLISGPSPPEVPPPEDSNLKVMIDGVAALVARCGNLFEDISREKNKTNPLFSFLNGGSGHDYYARKLWEERQKRTDQIKWQPDEKLYSTVQKMSAESRGQILGERPLDRTLKDSSSLVHTDAVHAQSTLSDTFTKPESFRELLETAKPYKDDPAKQERFEQFLKDKYQGGLRSTDLGKTSNMSEASRARERLDFEAAAEAIEKAKSATQTKLSVEQLLEFSMATGRQFTSGGVEHGTASSTEQLISKKEYPKREEFGWRPAPLLCRRFDIVDPYMGKPPPAPRMRSKLDSLVLAPHWTKMEKTEDVIKTSDQSPMSSKNNEDAAMEMSSRQPEAPVEVENVERPVDLYKAIFSDDSDNEDDESGNNQTEDPQKKTEAATAALSRLVAGDFLVSLGKELGLEVPPDLPPTTSKTTDSSSHKDVINDTEYLNTVPKDMQPSASFDENRISGTQEEVEVKSSGMVGDHEGGAREKSPSRKKMKSDIKHDREDQRGRKEKYERRSSSSEDERSRKRSKRRRHRESSSDDDSSDDSRDQYRSRSRNDKRRSSRRKHRRRKHSKHR